MVRGISFGTLLALVAHVFFGWWLAAFGAVVAGRMSRGSAVLAGTGTMLLAWGLLVGYNFLVATEETAEMARVTAALIGGLPAWVTVVATLIIAAVLGALGGWLGGTLRTSAQD